MNTGAVTYSNTVPASAPAVAPAPYVAPAPAYAPAPYVAPAPCPGGTVVNNSDGTVSCVQQVGVASNGLPISKVNIHRRHISIEFSLISVPQVTNLTTGVVSYVTQTGYNAYGQPVYQVTNQYGQVIGNNVVG